MSFYIYNIVLVGTDMTNSYIYVDEQICDTLGKFIDNESSSFLSPFFVFILITYDREPYKFNAIQKGMITLLERRRDLISSTLTQDQIAEMRMIIISKIDWGNSILLLFRTFPLQDKLFAFLMSKALMEFLQNT
uniref:Dedicator of cytokinesis N-terminal domain-containing protein n=1 Tax=Megaselia scalaris TaxID=36166 RepID=T1GB49_MEGSC